MCQFYAAANSVYSSITLCSIQNIKVLLNEIQLWLYFNRPLIRYADTPVAKFFTRYIKYTKN